jgi:hypothetical protein
LVRVAKEKTGSPVLLLFSPVVPAKAGTHEHRAAFAGVTVFLFIQCGSALRPVWNPQ